MSTTFENIRHDGGTHRVEVEIEGDQCIIRFGASFTLRVNEANLNTLRELIHDAVRDMAIERRDTTGVHADYLEEDLIQAGNSARSETQTVDVFDYNPNDPANW